MSMSTEFGLVPGVYNVSPQTNPGKTLVVDLSCFIAGARSTRNVLKTRNTAQNSGGGFTQEAFELPAAATGQAPSQKVIVAPTNVATVVSSDLPVHIILTTNNGTLDLGLNTLFVITNSVVSLNFINDAGIGTANVNCLII